ncbi:peptidoglycan-binding domain-containing protein [Streptacidiphilus sp. PAMC 29251]
MIKKIVGMCLLSSALVLATAPLAAAAPAPISYNSPSCPTSLTSGEDDGCVTFLQESLNDLGFGLSVDGDFGAHTLAAVKWVQTKAHLANSSFSVDGQVGPQTKPQILLDAGWWAQDGCNATIDAHPNSGTAQGTIYNDTNGYTCSGFLETSNNGGASWSEVTGISSVAPNPPAAGASSVTTPATSDTASQLVRVCAYAGSAATEFSCTNGF